MRISPVSVGFGKKLTARCELKDKENQTCHASIYEYMPGEIGDMIEIENSPNTTSIKKLFMQRSMHNPEPAPRFFAMRNDETGDIVACTQLSRHYAALGKYQGYYTSVDELETNGNYDDVLTPMLGYISYKAKQLCSENILTAFRTYEMPELKQHGFKTTKTDSFAMRFKNFEKLFSKASEKNNLKLM